MGTVFSSQSPHKLFDQIFSALKANEKYITIDLNEHYIPNHKQYDMEHYIQQSKITFRKLRSHLRISKPFCSFRC
jgi:hypothetical protein